jgi:hypothetical protein
MLIGMPFCPMCGTKAEPGQSFCENCGSALQEPSQQIVSPYLPQASLPPIPPPPPVYSPPVVPLKEQESPQNLSVFKRYKLPIIAIAGILVILIVFLAIPKGPLSVVSGQTMMPTSYPTATAAQQVYTTKSSTPVSTSPSASSQVSGGALSTTQYSPSSKAQFRANRTAGPAPLTVSFYDLTLGGPIKWVWDFGDTSGSSERNPVHTYRSPGKYTVTMNTVISGTMYSNSMNITVTGS